MTPEEKDKIINKYSSICYCCKNARKPWSNNLRDKGYVGCCGRAFDYPHTFDYDVILEGKEVAEGWVDLKSGIFGKGSGVVTNYQMITFMIKLCNQFNHNDNYSL